MSNRAANLVLLYVEDEPDDIFFMQQAFKRAGAGHVLQAVSDGKQAIDYLLGDGEYGDRERYPLPTAMLLDVNLPARSGFELLTWVRQQPQLNTIPVVMFSSSGRPDDRARAEQLGADDYLLKPASGIDFVQIINHLQKRWAVGL